MADKMSFTQALKYSKSHDSRKITSDALGPNWFKVSAEGHLFSSFARHDFDILIRVLPAKTSNDNVFYCVEDADAKRTKGIRTKAIEWCAANKAVKVSVLPLDDDGGTNQW